MPYDDASDPSWNPLVDAAWAARERAHAPYSCFRVGAALGFPGGLQAGCNVENAAYPMCTCAERTALCAAVAAGMKGGDPEALVVVTEAETLTPPCGACRQLLTEFAEELPILLVNRHTRALHRLSELLPHSFSGRNFLPPGPAPNLSQGLAFRLD